MRKKGPKHQRGQFEGGPSIRVVQTLTRRLQQKVHWEASSPPPGTQLETRGPLAPSPTITQIIPLSRTSCLPPLPPIIHQDCKERTRLHHGQMLMTAHPNWWWSSHRAAWFSSYLHPPSHKVKAQLLPPDTYVCGDCHRSYPHMPPGYGNLVCPWVHTPAVHRTPR